MIPRRPRKLRPLRDRDYGHKRPLPGRQGFHASAIPPEKSREHSAASIPDEKPDGALCVTSRAIMALNCSVPNAFNRLALPANPVRDPIARIVSELFHRVDMQAGFFRHPLADIIRRGRMVTYQSSLYVAFKSSF